MQICCLIWIFKFVKKINFFKKGPINLSGEAPRTTEEIEKMMAKKSVLDDFILPNLDK